MGDTQTTGEKRARERIRRVGESEGESERVRESPREAVPKLT